MPPFGCYYNSYMPYSNRGYWGDFVYPTHRPMMYRPYDGFRYTIGNMVGSFLGECFANYFGPVSTALSDVSRYRGYQAAEKIYNYYGLA